MDGGIFSFITREGTLMKNTLRVGIVGCGTIGGYILESVAAGKVDQT